MSKNFNSPELSEGQYQILYEISKGNDNRRVAVEKRLETDSDDMSDIYHINLLIEGLINKG